MYLSDEGKLILTSCLPTLQIPMLPWKSIEMDSIFHIKLKRDLLHDMSILRPYMGFRVQQLARFKNGSFLDFSLTNLIYRLFLYCIYHINHTPKNYFLIIFRFRITIFFSFNLSCQAQAEVLILIESKN